MHFRIALLKIAARLFRIIGMFGDPSAQGVAPVGTRRFRIMLR